jgi:hypothetical protein
MGRTRSSWSPERRERQRNAIQRTRPWSHSSGPKTAAGKKKSSQNALRFRTDPEARAAYELIQSFLATGIVPPSLGELWAAAYLNPLGDDSQNDLLGLEHDGDAPTPELGELWAASYLNPMSDDCCNDLLGFATGDDGLLDEPVSALCESLLDYLPGDIEGDDNDDWFGDNDGGPQLVTQPPRPVGDANDENAGRCGHNCDHGNRLDRRR